LSENNDKDVMSNDSFKVLEARVLLLEKENKRIKQANFGYEVIIDNLLGRVYQLERFALNADEVYEKKKDATGNPSAIVLTGPEGKFNAGACESEAQLIEVLKQRDETEPRKEKAITLFRFLRRFSKRVKASLLEPAFEGLLASLFSMAAPKKSNPEQGQPGGLS
jgi:hypothetical protein